MWGDLPLGRLTPQELHPSPKSDLGNLRHVGDRCLSAAQTLLSSIAHHTSLALPGPALTFCGSIGYKEFSRVPRHWLGLRVSPSRAA